jgi:hypothetical protein
MNRKFAGSPKTPVQTLPAPAEKLARMRRGISLLFVMTTMLTFNISSASAQLPSISDAPVLAKLSEILRVHRQHLLEAVRTTRGIEQTVQTLRHIDDYERSLRSDVGFINSLDMTSLDDLERLILYGDQTDFYFRSLSGKINAELYNAQRFRTHGEGFVGSLEGLGIVDERLLAALYGDDKTLAEMGITQQEAQALIKGLSTESVMLDMYQIKGTEQLIRSLTDHAMRMRELANDPNAKLEPGERVMLLQKSEESLIEALKYQLEYGQKLEKSNANVWRRLQLKSEVEAEIAQLQKFYEWHSSLEHNLGFFDSNFIKRETP